MAIAAFTEQLADYGPDCSIIPPSLSDAREYCRRLAESHYENFTVASWLLPRELRPHFHAIYAWCRWADDLADEAQDPARSLELLDWWDGELTRCYEGAATHPVYVALADTIQQFEIPTAPFADLLTAFRQDQTVTAYETFSELLDYCRHSANPVGRLVLYLGRCCRADLAEYADSICTGLQLVNFWQDVASDLDHGRVYLPRHDRQRAGYTDQMLARREFNEQFVELLKTEVAVAENFLRAGLPLVRLAPKDLKLDVALFIQGGLAAARRIRQVGFNVWSTPPKLRRRDGVRIVGASLWHAYRPTLNQSSRKLKEA